MKKFYSFGMVVFTAVCILAVLCSSVYAARKDTVRVALRYDPGTINILELKQGSDITVALAVNEGLMGVDAKTGKRTPLLIESYQVLPNKKDIKMVLKKGICFSTGDSLTATDVQWTYKQVANPKNANIMAGPVDDIESVEVVDDRTLIFHFFEPYAPWQELMWIGICSKKYYDRVGPDQFRKHPAGTGVFKFVSRKIGESVLMEVNRNYWDKKKALPNFRYLEFVTVPDDQTRQAMLETGELDIVNDLLPHQLKRLQANKRVKVKRCTNVPSMIGLGGRVYGDPIMKDRNFTHAVSHAINRQEIVDKIFLGEGYPLYLFASRSELGYDPKFKMEFNPKLAKEYLRKSTYKAGHPIMVTYSSGVPNSALVAAALQQYMKAIGVNAQIRQLEAGTEATYTRNRDPKIGAYVLYSWAGGRDPSTRLMLTLKSTSPYASYINRPRQKELNEAVDAQAGELDVKKRLKLLRKIHDLILEDGDGIILYGLNMIYATSDRVDFSWTPEEAILLNLDTVKLLK